MSEVVLDGHERVGLLSPLAVDLALSRTSLAALKIQAGVQLDEEERKSIVRLRRYYEKNRYYYKISCQLTEETGPSDTMRQALQQTPAAVLLDAMQRQIPTESVLEKLLNLLDKLEREESLEESEVKEILEVLQGMDASVAENDSGNRSYLMGNQ